MTAQERLALLIEEAGWSYTQPWRPRFSAAGDCLRLLVYEAMEARRGARPERVRRPVRWNAAAVAGTAIAAWLEECAKRLGARVQVPVRRRRAGSSPATAQGSGGTAQAPLRVRQLADDQEGGLRGDPRNGEADPAQAGRGEARRPVPLHAEVQAGGRVEDYDHNLFAYTFRVQLYQRDAQAVLAEGYGSANSREGRYRWRQRESEMPEVRQGDDLPQQEVRPGFSASKKGGCGAKFGPMDATVNRAAFRTPGRSRTTTSPRSPTPS
jgi:hypothetical protein